MAREQFQTLTEPMYYIFDRVIRRMLWSGHYGKVQKISGGRVKVGPERCIQCCLNLRKIRLFSGQKKKEEESLM